MEGFKIIVFTSPDSQEREAEKITELLELGVDYVHLRKPGWGAEETGALIEVVPQALRSRLVLHDHFELGPRLGIGRFHLNSRCRECRVEGARLSRSLHSFGELDSMPGWQDYEYVTLSPIFDSISKAGYKSAFDPAACAAAIRGKRVVALGGVTPARLEMLREIGFYGAALLGYIWGGDFNEIKKELCFNS